MLFYPHPLIYTKSFKTYPGPMLPPGDRKRQLIYTKSFKAYTGPVLPPGDRKRQPIYPNSKCKNFIDCQNKVCGSGGDGA